MKHLSRREFVQAGLVAGAGLAAATRTPAAGSKAPLTAAPPTTADVTVWGNGQLFCFSGLDGATDFDHGLVLRSGPAGCVLEAKLPGNLHLDFSSRPPVACRFGCDWFTLNLEGGGRVRGAFLDAWHLLIEGPCTCTPVVADRVSADGLLRLRREGDRLLIASTGAFQPALIEAALDAAITARQRWCANLPFPPSADTVTRQVLAKCHAQMKGQVYGPQGQLRRRFTTPDRWPHRGMWLWDSAFHAIGYRHLDPALAAEILTAALDGQREDGFVPIRSDPHFATAHFTQPPVLALAAMLVHDKLADRAWLEHLYPKLRAYVRWDLAHRDSDGAGLVEWAIEAKANSRSGESGMDNSPRFDNATRLDATDFNSFLAHECEHLAAIADLLGRSAEAAEWRQTHSRLCRLIRERLWSDQHRFFVDYDVEHGVQSDVLASAGFLPLLCGAATPAQAQRLRDALHDPTLFATALPVASIAVRDAARYQKDMWRGPVWVNINWCIARGLERYGYAHEARALDHATADETARCCVAHGTLFEFFDDRHEVEPPALLRKGKCAPDVSPFHQVFHDYGWTATLFVDYAWRRN